MEERKGEFPDRPQRFPALSTGEGSSGVQRRPSRGWAPGCGEAASGPQGCGGWAGVASGTHPPPLCSVNKPYKVGAVLGPRHPAAEDVDAFTYSVRRIWDISTRTWMGGVTGSETGSSLRRRDELRRGSQGARPPAPLHLSGVSGRPWAPGLGLCSRPDQRARRRPQGGRAGEGPAASGSQRKAALLDLT